MHILQHVDWNPLNLHAPNQHLLPAAETLDDNISFGEGKELIIDVPVDPKGVVDVYIDDTLGLTVEEEGSDNIMRLERAILLAIYVASRPKDANEPIPREEMAALNKLIAEAGLEEENTILGWLFNFRKLLISLPENKYTAWSDGIKEMMEEGKAKCSDLETLVGRLTHLSMVIPGVNHFLSRLRDLHIRSKNRRSIKISDVCMADLDLMLFFLGKAKLGIDMNLLSYRRPTHIYRSDSCPAGLGGYSCEGWAWRYYLPEHLKSRASNNLLEHIGSIITPWVDIINNRLVEGDCALSMTDSSTSEGWNKKTNFSEMIDDPIQATIRIEVCRGHAMRMLERGIRDYSQWFPGDENDVSDALSRDNDRSDEELTNILRKFVPSQLPERFEIVQLPNEIVCWLTSLLLKLPVKTQLQEKHTTTKIGRGEDGLNILIPLESRTTSTSIPSPKDNASECAERLPWLSVKEGFQDHLMVPWLKAQSKVPWDMWHRPSETTTTQIQPMTKTINLAAFYQGNTAHSETRTPHQSNKRHCP